jgi:hypothetical protein
MTEQRVYLATAAEVELPAGVMTKPENLSGLANPGESRENLHIPELLPVQAVATANVASLSGLPTVDGFTFEAEQLVLLTAQTEAKNNGPWAVAAGAWTRPTDFSTGAVVKARKVAVVNGTVNAHTEWLLKTNQTVTVGTTAQTWELLLPASVVSDSRGKAPGDVLVFGESSFVRLPIGASGETQLVVRSDGTLQYIPTPEILASAWEVTANGVTNDWAALLAAWEAAQSKGAVLRLPAGVINLAPSSAVKGLPVEPGKLPIMRGQGRGAKSQRGATTLKLSANCPTLTYFNRTAAGQTFNHELSDFTVDANNIGGNLQVVAGSLASTGFLEAFNITHARVERVNTINVPSDGTENKNTRRNVSYVCQQKKAGETEENLLEDIVVRDCDFAGGNYGAQVNGILAEGTSTTEMAANAANIKIDRVLFQNCYWDSMVLPTGAVPAGGAAGFFIGSLQLPCPAQL